MLNAPLLKLISKPILLRPRSVATMNTYTVTIRAHDVKKFVCYEMIDIIIHTLKTNYNIFVGDGECEEDPKYKQLHFHGIAVSAEPIVYKDVSSMFGFRLYWKEIKNLNAYKEAQQYVHKSSIKDQFKSSIEDDSNDSLDAQ